MDSLPLTHKVAYRHQTVIQGQGRFTKHGLPVASTACSVKGILALALGMV